MKSVDFQSRERLVNWCGQNRQGAAVSQMSAS